VKLGLAIDEVQDAELDLAKQLIALAERHQQESDVYHTGLARAHVCADHIWQLRPFVEAYEAHSVNIGEETTPGLLDTLRQGLKAIGLTPVSGVALLHDLRDVYVTAHRVEIDWIVLQQAAKSARATELIAVTLGCAEEAEQTWKWLRTRIKETAPQALATS
jgi:hypothetical protein